VKRSAFLSNDGVYRYELTRTWGEGDRLLWVMLNPSTADADLDDPTIRRVIGFSRAWGFSGAIVANLFALRSTDPKVLRTHPDPVGPANNGMLAQLALRAPFAVCAWGAHGWLHNRDREVLALLESARCLPRCLGRTSSGAPKHPLYLAASTPLEPMR
jgi:hypothetical protein